MISQQPQGGSQPASALMTPKRGIWKGWKGRCQSLHNQHRYAMIQHWQNPNPKDPEEKPRTMKILWCPQVQSCYVVSVGNLHDTGNALCQTLLFPLIYPVPKPRGLSQLSPLKAWLLKQFWVLVVWMFEPFSFFERLNQYSFRPYSVSTKTSAFCGPTTSLPVFSTKGAVQNFPLSLFKLSVDSNLQVVQPRLVNLHGLSWVLSAVAFQAPDLPEGDSGTLGDFCFRQQQNKIYWAETVVWNIFLYFLCFFPPD